MPDPSPDLLRRRATRFVLWRPAHARSAACPGYRAVCGGPATARRCPAAGAGTGSGIADLWAIDLADCGLADGVYHYWFEVPGSRPGTPADAIQVTDPAAATADWRLLSPALPPPYDGSDRSAPAVVLVSNGRLIPCDPAGELPDWRTTRRWPGCRPITAQYFASCPPVDLGGGRERRRDRYRNIRGCAIAGGSRCGVAEFPVIPALAVGRSYLASSV